MNSAKQIDRLVLTRLPGELGRPSDFEFEWEGVAFTQRVWESQLDDGAWRVDLQVQVLRSPALTDRDALRDFLAEYHERDDRWAREPLGDNGFVGEREAAVLIEAGLAAEVRDPFDRQGLDAVKRIAEGIRLLES